MLIEIAWDYREPELVPGPPSSADGGEGWWFGGAANPPHRAEIEERPWRSGSWSCRRIPCCPCPSLMKREPHEEANNRILRFKEWLDGRPEKTIVVVGHSHFFQQTIAALAGTKMPKLANCEVLDCESVGLVFDGGGGGGEAAAWSQQSRLSKACHCAQGCIWNARHMRRAPVCNGVGAQQDSMQWSWGAARLRRDGQVERVFPEHAFVRCSFVRSFQLQQPEQCHTVTL